MILRAVKEPPAAKPEGHAIPEVHLSTSVAYGAIILDLPVAPYEPSHAENPLS